MLFAVRAMTAANGVKRISAPLGEKKQQERATNRAEDFGGCHCIKHGPDSVW